VIDTGPAAYEQRVFVAVVVDGIPLDALAARRGVRRGTIYKTDFKGPAQLRAGSPNSHLAP
jgi:RNA polymerase sigma-70 factor (ECF subfamily)